MSFVSNSNNEIQKKDSKRHTRRYTLKALGFISLDSPIRVWSLRLAKASGFDEFILTMIVLNSITMACVDYRHVDEFYKPLTTDSWRNKSIEIAEIIFMVIFIVECLVKILAFGLVKGRNAYLRNVWNCFDFLIVMLSVISVIPIFPNLSALRSFRVLRPLRSVGKLPGLRKVIGALIDSIGDLSNVMFLLTFLIICFSISGMLFWNGLLHSRCRVTPFPVVVSEQCNEVTHGCWNEYIQNVTSDPDLYRCLSDANDDAAWTQSTSPWFIQGPKNCIWPVDDTDGRVCSLNEVGRHHCPSDRTCGSNYDAFGNPRFIDSNQPYGYSRMKYGTFIEDLNWGFTNYDSFLPAFLTTFQVITLEGWTSVMYQLIDAWYLAPTVAIFCIQVILCGYIVLNLVLAVISRSMDELEEDDEDYGDDTESNSGYDDEKSVAYSIKSERFLGEVIGGKKHTTFIMACIIVNTIILSIDHYGISDETADLMEYLNSGFTVIFVVDVILCNLSYGVKRYWSDKFMCFDGIIGIISFIELILIYSAPQNSGGSTSSFSVFRSLRLFRVFKMAKNWKSLQALLRTIISSVYEIGNFATLLLLFMYIYSLVGLQLLSNRMRFSKESGSPIDISEKQEFEEAFIPRAHFDNFLWSMVTVFQILTGENWNSILYDSWRARGWLAVIFIISLVVIGVFIVMNLFLAILLKNFEDSGNLVDQSRIDQLVPETVRTLGEFNARQRKPTTIQILWAKLGRDNPFRKLCFEIVESQKFDIIVTLFILGSSICLAIDNPLVDPNAGYVKWLQIFDFIFTSLFIVEMIVKVLAYGLVFEKNSYLRSAWNVLDFIVVIISILNLANIGPGKALRALRTLRVLRPLRMVNRLPELKVVVDALLLSFPSVADVAVLCALFFLIFASFALAFLKGTFYHCSGESFDALSTEQVEYLTYPYEWGLLSSEEKAWFDVDTTNCNAASWSATTIPSSKDICDCFAPDSWQLVIPQNFNNVANGMALLLEISTTEGWTNVMYAAIDQRGVEMQPVKNNNPVWAIFFIAFLIVGAFFVLELFVGVTIDNFKKIREKTGKGIMTEAQRNWARTQAFVLKIRPMHRVQKPEGCVRALCYDFIMPDVNPAFENFITFCIIASLVVATLASFGDSDLKLKICNYLNLVFACVFTIELVLKLLVLRLSYFEEQWNKFDFVIVCSTNIGLVVGIFYENTGPIISLVRLARIFRLFRLVKKLKKLRTLFNTLIVSIPSIANIGTLLLLLFFVYAIVGMQLYSFIPDNEYVNTQANFRNFGSTMLLLLRFSTGEDWNGFMRSIVHDNDGCNPVPTYNSELPWCLRQEDYPDCTPLNGCGAGASAFIYFYSFTLLVSFVILNLFVGIVLEAFETSDEGDILSPDDLEDFTNCWARFDPNATWYIRAADMKKFVMNLKPPLGIGQWDVDEANVMLNDPCLMSIPVDKDDRVNIVHTANALAKRLTVKKQGESFNELAADHPLQQQFLSALPKQKSQRTLNDVYIQKTRKKLRILKAFVRSNKIHPMYDDGKDTEGIIEKESNDEEGGGSRKVHPMNSDGKNGEEMTEEQRNDK